MTCNQLCRLLSDGQTLPAAAHDHLAACEGCRALQASLAEFPVDVPALNSFAARMTENLAPVRPLPSNRTLTLLFTALFIVFALSAAMPVGYLGFYALSIFQKVAIYAGISACALFLSATLVPQMIPGAKRSLNPAVVFPTVLLALVLITLAMFDNFAMDRFVARGIPCFRFGTICAAGSGMLVWLLLRKGFLISPLLTGITAGGFAGLTGFAVLALHCPIQNVTHVVVWHLGVIAVASFAGMLIAWLAQKYARPSRLK